MAELKNNLAQSSEFLELITKILASETKKKVAISQCHGLKTGDGSHLFLVVTQEKRLYLVDLVGRKIQDNALIYWVENIDQAGKIADIYYERDLLIITFFRGEKFNNEYLSYIYTYGNRYPAIKFIAQNDYEKYTEVLAKLYKKQKLDLPGEFIYQSPEQ